MYRYMHIHIYICRYTYICVCIYIYCCYKVQRWNEQCVLPQVQYNRIGIGINVILFSLIWPPKKYFAIREKATIWCSQNCATLQTNQRCGSICMTWSKRWVIHSLILCRTTAQLKETDTPVTTLAADCVTFTIQLSLLPVLCPRNAPIKVSPLWLSTCALEDTAARRGSALACRPKGNRGRTGLRKKKKKWFHLQKKK